MGCEVTYQSQPLGIGNMAFASRRNSGRSTTVFKLVIGTFYMSLTHTSTAYMLQAKIGRKAGPAHL